MGEDAITGIGNNVSLEFDHMDFGEDGFEKLLICGRTPLEKNTIHVRFLDRNGIEIKQIAEFVHFYHAFPLLRICPGGGCLYCEFKAYKQHECEGAFFRWRGKSASAPGGIQDFKRAIFPVLL